jgi:FixJ family two-component response regulator
MIEAPATVFIVDDDESVCRALTRLLRANGLVAEAYLSAAAFLECLPREDAGCAILDLQLPEMNGIELQQKLAEISQTLPILFLSAYGDVPTTVRAMKQGALDFMTKPVDVELLISAVRAAIAGQKKIIEQQSARQRARALAATLTPRERDVALGVIAGRLNKQIAADLGIVEKTVKIHRGHVMEKMGVKSVADLVRLGELAEIRAKTTA